MLSLIPKIILLKSLLLSGFPSGSSINYYDGRLYLVGDDASRVAVLDHLYREVGTIPLFDHQEQRIPKAQKTDLETAVLVNIHDKPHLLALDSASRKEREKGLLIPLSIPGSGQPPSAIDLSVFVARLKQAGIAEVNIEGATIIGDQLVLANRGNNTYRENHLIVTDKDFWARQHEAAISVLPLALPQPAGRFTGVSELCYAASANSLLITFSSEATANAYDDGVIGDSYIGWVSDIRQKTGQPGLTLDGLINLSETDERFKGEKIEGICIERAADNELLLHLVADNDQGQSRLFAVKMIMDHHP